MIMIRFQTVGLRSSEWKKYTTKQKPSRFSLAKLANYIVVSHIIRIVFYRKEWRFVHLTLRQKYPLLIFWHQNLI